MQVLQIEKLAEQFLKWVDLGNCMNVST